jgi:hypothetical protein
MAPRPTLGRPLLSYATQVALTSPRRARPSGFAFAKRTFDDFDLSARYPDGFRERHPARAWDLSRTLFSPCRVEPELDTETRLAFVDLGMLRRMRAAAPRQSLRCRARTMGSALGGGHEDAAQESETIREGRVRRPRWCHSVPSVLAYFLLVNRTRKP